MKPLRDLTLPPLRVYTFVPVTGQIITKVIVDQACPKAKAKPKSAAGTGSASGAQPPVVDKPVEKLAVSRRGTKRPHPEEIEDEEPEDAEALEDEGGEEQDDDEEEDVVDDDGQDLLTV